MEGMEAEHPRAEELRNPAEDPVPKLSPQGDSDLRSSSGHREEGLGLRVSIIGICRRRSQNRWKRHSIVIHLQGYGVEGANPDREKSQRFARKLREMVAIGHPRRSFKS